MNNIRKWMNIVESVQGATVTRSGNKFNIKIDTGVFSSERMEDLEISPYPTNQGDLEFEGTLKGLYFYYTGIYNNIAGKKIYGSIDFTVDSHGNIDKHDIEVNSEEIHTIVGILEDFDEDSPPRYDAHGNENEEYDDYYQELYYYVDDRIDLHIGYVDYELEMIVDYIETNIGSTVDDLERARSTADDSILDIE